MLDYIDQIRPLAGIREPFNAFSHLLGAGVFAILSWFLLKRGRGDVKRLVALAIFAFAGVLMLSMSGVYHVLPLDSPGRAILRRLDHAAIFLLIAGTFTPIHAILFRGVGRWGMLTFIWTAAVIGIVLKTVFFQAIPPWLHVMPYIVLGWVGLISALTLYRSRSWSFIRLLVYGGIAYTLGVACLALILCGSPMIVPGVVGRHELFHVGVLIGMACHWRFVYGFAHEAVPNRSAALGKKSKAQQIAPDSLGQ